MSTSDRDKTVPALPSRLMLIALAGAFLLAVGAGALFYYATQTIKPAGEAVAYKVVVGDSACEPQEITVPAGRTTFEIYNASRRPVEWEILDGVMVVEERENIAPGFHSLLTAKLVPGTYDITCGLLSNPRGKLVVTPSAESEAEKAQPALQAFIGPLSEYRVFLILQASALARETEKLASAIKAGDLEGAKAAYLAARLPYKRIETAMGRVGDLRNAIDSIADYFSRREEDPAFTGFHRIEYALFAQKTLADLDPVAAKLSADVAALKDRLRTLEVAPEELAGNAERLARRLADGQIQAGESRYAGSDLTEIEAGLEGIEKSVMVLEPLAVGADPAVAAGVKNGIGGARSELAKLKSDRGNIEFGAVDLKMRQALASSFLALANAIAKLNPALGLD